MEERSSSFITRIFPLLKLPHWKPYLGNGQSTNNNFFLEFFLLLFDFLVFLLLRFSTGCIGQWHKSKQMKTRVDLQENELSLSKFKALNLSSMF